MRVTVEVTLDVTPIEVYLRVDGHQMHESICSIIKGAFSQGKITVGGVQINKVEAIHYYAEAKEG